MSVFDEFRRAWRRTVDNFWRELEADDPEGQGRAAYREVARVRDQLGGLDDAIEDARQRLAHEKEQQAACARRERMARGIGDMETARVAAEYGARHGERAGVLERKLEVLEAERHLCRRDMEEMERALQDGRVAAGSVRPELDDLNRHPREHEFRDLEEGDRGRSAEERLDELKRRMSR